MPVFPTDDEPFRAQLILEDGSLEGRVVDNDQSSILVAFTPEDAPQLPIAEEVQIELTGNDASLKVKARVVFQGERDHQIEYRFRLGPKDAPRLARLFRRRTAFRATPDPRQPINVGVMTDEQLRFDAAMFDISAKGLSLLVNADDETKLFRSKHLRLTFHLPNQARLSEVFAVVRQRSLEGSVIRYGLQLDPRATEDFALQIERITRYVVHRQLEMIREQRRA